MFKKVLIILSVVTLSMPFFSQLGVADTARAKDLFSDKALEFILAIDKKYPYILLTKKPGQPKDDQTNQQGVSSDGSPDSAMDQMAAVQKVVLMAPGASIHGKENKAPLSSIQNQLPKGLLPILSVEGKRSQGSWAFTGLTLYLPLFAFVTNSYNFSDVLSSYAAPLAAVFGMSTVLFDSYMTSSMEVTSQNAKWWPWAYIANQSKADSAAEEIVAHLDQVPDTEELVILVPKKTFRAIQKNLLNNDEFSVIQEQIYPSRWTTQVTHAE